MQSVPYTNRSSPTTASANSYFSGSLATGNRIEVHVLRHARLQQLLALPPLEPRHVRHDYRRVVRGGQLQRPLHRPKRKAMQQSRQPRPRLEDLPILRIIILIPVILIPALQPQELRMLPPPLDLGNRIWPPDAGPRRCSRTASHAASIAACVSSFPEMRSVRIPRTEETNARSVSAPLHQLNERLGVPLAARESSSRARNGYGRRSSSWRPLEQSLRIPPCHQLLRLLAQPRIPQ